MKDPDLFKASWPDNDRDSYEPDSRMIHFLIHDDTNIYGLFEVKEFTKITAELHVHIIPKYWGTGISTKAGAAMADWFRNNTQIRTLVTYRPASINHMERNLIRCGMKKTGVIPNGIVWDGVLTDFYIYTIDLYKELEK